MNNTVCCQQFFELLLTKLFKICFGYLFWIRNFKKVFLIDKTRFCRDNCFADLKLELKIPVLGVERLELM